MQAIANQPTPDAQRPIAQELDFLIRRTGQDESTLLGRAVRLGLDMLYRQAAEKAFIHDTLTRVEAVAVLVPNVWLRLNTPSRRWRKMYAAGLGL